MLLELPRTQREVFDRANKWLNSQEAADSSHASQYQNWQIRLALAMDLEDQDALAEALTQLLQDLYMDCLAQVRCLELMFIGVTSGEEYHEPFWFWSAAC